VAAIAVGFQFTLTEISHFNKKALINLALFFTTVATEILTLDPTSESRGSRNRKQSTVVTESKTQHPKLLTEYVLIALYFLNGNSRPFFPKAKAFLLENFSLPPDSLLQTQHLPALPVAHRSPQMWFCCLQTL